MIHSASLIALVHFHPALWDYGNENYCKKKWKKKIWADIAEKFHVPVDEVKSHWANLRDTFRRDLQKCLKRAKESGDPCVPEPRWRHFRSMLFLKDHVTKDEMVHSIQFIDTLHIPPVAIIADVSTVKTEDGTIMVQVTDSSQNQQLDATLERCDEQHPPPNERHPLDDEFNDGEDSVVCVDDTPTYEEEVDEDYHFLMSILPAVRRIRQDRKTSFKMKVLQLIMDEENIESTAT